jgi:tetratricopeptide (TPR) repeat protein/predicted Ser/Thr protein kinase
MQDDREDALASDLPTPRALVPDTGPTLLRPTMLSDAEVLARLEASDRIGRFTVLRRLGEGGMGIVSLAYDEELDRKLALKVIRQGFCDQPEHRRRFIREAQSLARLSHPNVVTIYEVGEYLGRPYLAMEFVDGCDLRTWRRQAKRSTKEVLRVFLDAGRGLAAAHAAGLVHRDFKPANILVGVDGRARVLDFGISRAADNVVDLAHAATTSPEGPQSGDTLTVVGTLMGTPAYMSPEQLLGHPLDFRSDQYAFAVALYETLVGARPFAGKTPADRLREGFTFTCPPDTRLSRPLQRALQRALAEAPEQRFGAMDELLAAITADPWRRWRRLGATLALAATTAGLGYGLSGPEPCTGATLQLTGVWDPDTRAALRTALHPEGSSAAGIDRLEERLDDYTTQWASTHREACMAHHRGDSSAEAHDLRIGCLGQALQGLGALVEVLRTRGPGDLDSALVDANNLPELRACLDLSALSRGPPPPPPEIAAEVEALRGQLARAQLTVQRADAEAALATVRPIEHRARALAYRPLVASALHTLARLESDLADYKSAARDLEAALWVTTSLDDPARTAQIMGSLIYLLGDRLDDDAAASRWRPHADALAERLGPDAPGTASLAWARGTTALHHGRIDEAVAELRRSVAISEALHGPDHLNVATYLGNLAAALGTARQYDEAKQAFERALVILERAYGTDHIAVITALGNLANVHTMRHETPQALALSEDALLRARRSRGDDHPQVATLLQNLARVRRDAGQPALARSDLLRAREIQNHRLGPHRELSWTLSELVLVELELDELTAAHGHAAELIDVALAVFPADAPAVLRAFVSAIDVADARHQPEAIVTLAERALARPLERIAHEAPDDLAYLRFRLASALRQLHRDPRRVSELADAARSVFLTDPESYADELAELARWRRPPRRAR